MKTYFSAEYLLQIALNYYEKCKLLKNLNRNENLNELKQCLYDQCLILIAYDCDKNFEPCFKNGTKAHWALVNGFMLPIKEEISTSEENRLVELNCDNEELTKKVKNFETNNDLIFTINLHGKSKHYGVWSLNELLKSNFQLKLIEQKRINEDYVLPENNKTLEDTLALQALVIY